MEEGMSLNQNDYGNNWERVVIGKEEKIPPKETSRYVWACDNLIGKKILELGCGCGYGLRLLPDDIDYIGVDNEDKIIEFARQHYDDKGTFIVSDLKNIDFRGYDTIIAFEILEHISYGKELAQSLKKYCKCLMITVPYNEPKGFWGEHHVLHNLVEKDFPDFDIKYILYTGEISDKPIPDRNDNLILMKWTKA